jgi:Protein of unknown function (DUF3443)
VRSFLVLVLVGTLGFLAGCGNSGTPSGIVISIALSPTSATLNAGQSLNIVATLTNDSTNAGVNWTLNPAVGTLSAQTTTSVTYTAPATVTATSIVTVVATSIASSSVTASLPITLTPAGTVGNTMPISVNGGLLGTNPIYPNGGFVSVTICSPSSGACQTIDNVLLDTGSVGLRLLGSQITVPLTPLNDGNGNTLYNCIQFLDSSFLWGTVAPANIQLGGETATSTSVQVIANPSFSIPSGCSGTNEDTQALLGANGILGVGPEPFDCGTLCDPIGNNGQQVPLVYYLCSSGGSCNTTLVPCGSICENGASAPDDQVTNPVFNFPTDNNGVIVQFPAVNDFAATVNGTVTFGIGTQSNNALPSTATVLNLDPSDSFTTNFNGQALSASFIDSGSNGLFFPQINNAPAICAAPNGTWYCPPSTTPYSATNVGASGTPSNTVNFSVDNFDNVTAANPNAAAFSNLAGPQGIGNCSPSNTTACTFDWGLPFFYGRSVFTAIDGTSVGNTAGPFFAY